LSLNRNCLRHVRDTNGLDLTSLRLSFTGAEPIRPRTVWEFEERFGLKNVLVPAYGLAEGIDDERLGTQRLVVVVEVREAEMPPDRASQLLKTISASIHSAQGFRPGQVLLVQKGTIPKTTSGKIQHARLVELINSRALDSVIVYPRRGQRVRVTPEP